MLCFKIIQSIYTYSYKENAQKASKIFLDLPESALNTAVYWVEYIIRNGHDYILYQINDVNWYEYLLLDIIITTIIVIILILLFFFKTRKYLNKF